MGLIDIFVNKCDHEKTRTDCGLYNHDWKVNHSCQDICRKCGLKRNHLNRHRSIELRTIKWLSIKTGKPYGTVFKEYNGGLV